MSLCYSLSCFWHLVQDPFCSRSVFILHRYHPFLTVLHVQDEFSSSLCNSFPPASFFFYSYPILLPFFLFFFLFSHLFSPVLQHVSISFSSACLAYSFYLASSPHIRSQTFSFCFPHLHIPSQAPWQVCSPHPVAWPVCSWVSMDNPRLLLLPVSKLPVPEFSRCHFPCPHLGWMEDTVTGEAQLFHCSFSLLQ